MRMQKMQMFLIEKIMQIVPKERDEQIHECEMSERIDLRQDSDHSDDIELITEYNEPTKRPLNDLSEMQKRAPTTQMFTEDEEAVSSQDEDIDEHDN